MNEHSDNKPEDPAKVEPPDARDYDESGLPEGVSFEDALRGFTEVDPEKVREAEKKAREEDPDESEDEDDA